MIIVNHLPTHPPIMPISKKWSRMNRAAIDDVPAKSGIYELTSFGEQRALYIGSSDDINRRLQEHLNSSDPNRFRYETAGLFDHHGTMEENAFERYERKYGEIPPWNDNDPRNE